MAGSDREVQSQITLSIVKPDGVRRGLIGAIIGRFERKGLSLRAIDFRRATEEQIRENYRDNADEPWFEAMVSFMTSGEIVPMAWWGPNAVASGRQIVGAKDVWESDAGSVRGEYAANPIRTVIHGSRTPEEAIREANIWFPRLLGVEEPVAVDKADPEPLLEPLPIVDQTFRRHALDLREMKSYVPLRR